jgi:hypothetical protein
MGTNNMMMTHVYDKPFQVIFSAKSKWKDGLQPNKQAEESGTQMVP